jgi:hypothetical protein
VVDELAMWFVGGLDKAMISRKSCKPTADSSQDAGWTRGKGAVGSGL